MTQRIRLAVIGAAIAMLVAACGGGDVATTPEDGPADTTATTAAGGDEDSLAAFFGWEEGDMEAQQMDYRDQEARVQESIRVCMAEEGFDYVPAMPPDETFTVWEEEDEEERVRTQGFGITTWYGEMGQAQQEQTEDTMMEWSDPNQERVDAMSESEQQAWYDALYGTQAEQEEDMTTEIDEETGETIYYSTGHGAGCQGEAYEAEYGSVDETQDLWEELNPAFEAMYAQVEADPRIVEANQAWSTCMASEGYEFESRNTMWDTVYTDFETRVNEIVGPNGGFVDPFEGWSEDEINAFFEEKSQEEIEAFFAEAEQASQTNIDEEALQALQQEEIDMAVADFECGEGWNDLYVEVSEEYEKDFIDANRAILEQIREAQGG